MGYGGHVVHMRERRDAYRILVERREAEPRERPRRRWDDNIKIDFNNFQLSCINHIQNI